MLICKGFFRWSRQNGQKKEWNSLSANEVITSLLRVDYLNFFFNFFNPVSFPVVSVSDEALQHLWQSYLCLKCYIVAYKQASLFVNYWVKNNEQNRIGWMDGPIRTDLLYFSISLVLRLHCKKKTFHTIRLYSELHICPVTCKVANTRCIQNNTIITEDHFYRKYPGTKTRTTKQQI